MPISEVAHYHLELEFPSKAVEGQARFDGVGDGLCSASYAMPEIHVMPSTTMALDLVGAGDGLCSASYVMSEIHVMSM